MRAAICGVGRMGTAIAYAMDKLGYQVIGMDSNAKASENIPHKINLQDGVTPKNEFFIVESIKDIEMALSSVGEVDVVISSLPYHQTEEVGKLCVDKGLRYCDLGGRVDVSANIYNYAEEKATKPIMTDLGLAPGWVNILAEEGYSGLYGHGPVQSVKMMVGGIPERAIKPPMNYSVTWSVDGLINEYKDDCEILENGEIKVVKGMDGLEHVETAHLGLLEAFYTSGGASHSIRSMQSRGVRNCSYKTLRYPGHIDIVKFLINDCELNDEQMRHVFEKGCKQSEGEQDVIIIKASVRKDEIRWDRELLITADEGGFSAMQKATAYAISSVAAIMGHGHFDNRQQEFRGYKKNLPLVLSYKDIPFSEFNKNLQILGII